MTSIRRWLLGWLIFGMAAASGMAGYGIFHTARQEASELFDYELRTVALSLPSNLAGAGNGEHRDPDLGDLADDRIVIEIWDRDGELIYHSTQAPVFSRQPAGFSTVERGEYHWRIFGVEQKDRYVQVAQPVSVREDLALQLALHTLWPLALLVPVTIVLVLLVVARGLAPIGGLSRALTHPFDRFAGAVASGRHRAGRNQAAGRSAQRSAAAAAYGVAGAAHVYRGCRARTALAARRAEAAIAGGFARWLVKGRGAGARTRRRARQPDHPPGAATVDAGA